MVREWEDGKQSSPEGRRGCVMQQLPLLLARAAELEATAVVFLLFIPVAWCWSHGAGSGQWPDLYQRAVTLSKTFLRPYFLPHRSEHVDFYVLIFRIGVFFPFLFLDYSTYNTEAISFSWENLCRCCYFYCLWVIEWNPNSWCHHIASDCSPLLARLKLT